MSFNPASSVSVSSASLHVLSSRALEQSSAHAAGGASTASVDDIPPCATPTPGHPPIPHGVDALLAKVALNPQPLPPTSFGGGKPTAFDDGGWCGTVPRKLPPFPPPPPGPWADIASAATGMAR